MISLVFPEAELIAVSARNNEPNRMMDPTPWVPHFVENFANLSEAIQGYGPLTLAILLKSKNMLSSDTLKKMEPSDVATQAYYILQSIESQIISSYEGSGLLAFKTFIDVLCSTRYQQLVVLAQVMARKLNYRTPLGRSDSIQGVQPMKVEDPVSAAPPSAGPPSLQTVEAKAEGNGASSHTIEPYKMTSDENGVALVISNTKWRSPKLEDRKECEGDGERVESTLEGLNYRNIRLRKNLTCDEMIKEIETAAKKVKETDCSFMLVLMSHGGEEGVYGVDSDTEEAKQLNIDKIIGILADQDSLKTKPKIILTNACRGNQIEPPSIKGKPEGLNFVTDGRGRIWIPHCSDLYISFSSTPGNIATRSEVVGGALYIHFLCETLNKYAGTAQLNDMVLIVHDEMAKKLVRITDDKGGDTHYLQCGHAVHTMRRPFFFKPRKH